MQCLRQKAESSRSAGVAPEITHTLSYRLVLLSFEWNSIRLGGPAHGIVTKTVHKTLPRGGAGQGGRGGRVGGGGVKGVVGSRGW